MKTKIGIVGCGRISPTYLRTFAEKFGGTIEVAACADIDREAAVARAAEFSIPKVLTVAELLADPAIEIVADLTIPEAHFGINRDALASGNHVYTEKPVALSPSECRELVGLAGSRGLRFSAAPDTLLGAGTQTCRKLIEEGAIGEPIAFSVSLAMNARGERYLRPAVGPTLDMGPYYIGALIYMLGSVRRVAAMTRQPVELAGDNSFAPSAAAVTLEMENGCIGTVLLLAEGSNYLTSTVVFGTERTLVTHDANHCGGRIFFRGKHGEDTEVPRPFAFDESRIRGLGIADMAHALRRGTPHRLSAELALHTTDVLFAILETGATGKSVEIGSRFEKTAPMRPLPDADPFAQP